MTVPVEAVDPKRLAKGEAKCALGVPIQGSNVGEHRDPNPVTNHEGTALHVVGFEWVLGGHLRKVCKSQPHDGLI
ncbi:MAG: hypothetical protein ACK5NW_13380 [Ottowia sp.]